MLLAIALSCLACAPRTAAPQSQDAAELARVERRVGAMGTWLVLEVEAATRAIALEASEAAIRAIETVEARLSTWREDSELSRLNRAPVGVSFELSESLSADLALARSLWISTNGAFDPSVGALVDAWGLRSGGRVPTSEERNAARVPGAFGALQLTSRTARRLAANLRVEEGAFGKGAGLDAALAALELAGASRARLDFGGHLAVLGGDFECAIADPRERSRQVLALVLESGSLSTSGNSEHGFESNGVRFGHLLDARTGEPARDFGSVSVWAREAFVADALSTGLFVMGPDAALEWARAHPEIEVLVLESAATAPVPSALRARATAGLAARLTVLRPDLQLVSIERERAREE